jgi:hypothetical protein
MLRLVRSKTAGSSSGPVRYAIVDGMNVHDSRVHNYPPRFFEHGLCIFAGSPFWEPEANDGSDHCNLLHLKVPALSHKRLRAAIRTGVCYANKYALVPDPARVGTAKNITLRNLFFRKEK